MILFINMNIERHYRKWTVNELLSLQREHELLEMTIPEIASLHKRTTDGILYKLQEEGMIQNENKVENETSYEKRVTRSMVSETSQKDTSEIKTIVKNMVGDYIENKKRVHKKVRRPLRKLRELPNY